MQPTLIVRRGFKRGLFQLCSLQKLTDDFNTVPVVVHILLTVLMCLPNSVWIQKTEKSIINYINLTTLVHFWGCHQNAKLCNATVFFGKNTIKMSKSWKHNRAQNGCTMNLINSVAFVLFSTDNIGSVFNRIDIEGRWTVTTQRAIIMSKWSREYKSFHKYIVWLIMDIHMYFGQESVPIYFIYNL